MRPTMPKKPLWRSISYSPLSLIYQTVKQLKKVNNTSPSLPKKHLESEQLFSKMQLQYIFYVVP